ncbi:MAG: hypothetical protein HY585_00530, partial [Candidatus Omnitrophica bacterium]|nr:hypothetical protein [Candidatus Omnitrophota bacterium]
MFNSIHKKSSFHIQKTNPAILIFLIGVISLVFAFGTESFADDPPWDPVLDPTPNIASDYTGWIAWKDKRVAQFHVHCPLERATTYYFSQSGDDMIGDGSEVNPLKTL